MRLIKNLLCAAAIGFAALASAAEPKNGAEYKTLPVAQNTDSGNKVEVIEFFAYYCPHCYRFEAPLAEWVKKQGANIAFKRVHVTAGPGVLPQQRLFFTLDALGLVDQYHDKVFEAMHVERNRLGSEQAVFEWAAKTGIDQAKFGEAWRSFGVPAKLRRADAMMGAYKVEFWPMVAIDGRFLTSPSQAGEASATALTEAQQQQSALATMDFLVAKAKAEKK